MTSNPATLTINQTPTVAAISGNSTVCLGSTIDLTDATSGGIWNTSNGNIARVSSSGAVTGLRAGTVTITYTITNACGQITASKNVTVDISPVSGTITGPATLCVHGTITLQNTTTGGTWSSTNSSIASVNATTGVVTGIRFGTATIDYTVSNACGIGTARKTVTVNCVQSAPGVADVENEDTVYTKEADLDVTFDAQVIPNPSQTDFMLTVHSTNTSRAAYVRIFDMSGRLIDEKRGAIGEPIRFGSTYVTGMYIVQVMQGDKLKVLKVIKD